MLIVQIPSSDSKLTPLSDSAIRSLFTPSTLEAGRIYELRGRVLELEIGADGSTILARTQGSAPNPYTQRIIIKPSKYQRLAISGQCTCPLGRSCKHIAAVLIACHRQQIAAEQFDPLPAHTRAPAREAAAEDALPHAIAGWLTDLQQAQDGESEDYPDTIRNRLIYLLDREAIGTGVPRLRIRPMNVPLRKAGGFGAPKPYAPHQVQTPARFLRPSDRLILTRLARGGHTHSDDDPADTLQRIIATGRAYWETLEGQKVTEGPAESGRIGWRMEPDGSQHAGLTTRDGLLPFRIPVPWYVDPASGAVGPLTLDLPTRLVQRLLDAPAIPPELAVKVRAELAARMPAIAVPAPDELPQPEKIAGPPIPHLRLINGTLPTDPARGRGSARTVGGGLFEVPLARLSFHYGPLLLPWTPQRPPRIVAQNGKLYEPQRDGPAEEQATDRLATLGFGRVNQLAPVYYRHAHTDDFALMESETGVDWMGVVTRDVATLRAEGWTVEIDEAFPLQVITPDGGFDAELQEGSGVDWLELHLGVQVDGQRVDLVPALIRLLAMPDVAGLLASPDGAPVNLPLPDGRLLVLPFERFRPMLEALLELHAGGVIDPGSGKIGFTRLDAVDLARFEEASGAAWKGGEAVRALGRQLREAGGTIPHAALPDSFKGSLRPYQSQGVDWLQFLRGAELGGILADDMGLGKTVQTLAHLAIEQSEGRLDRPALIVCPTSLIPNWTLEAARFAPSLKVLPLHGPARKDRFGDIPTHDLVLTTYPLLARDQDVLTAQDWHAVILDEAQTIKNPNAETTRQALRLKARQRLCLSGTPLQNHLGELWSLFDFLSPGFLGSQKAFRGRYRNPIEKHGDAASQERLSRRVRPFLLRRTKDEVVQDLPAKTEITEPVEMEGTQRAVYESIRMAMHTRVQAAIAQKGLARSGIIILDALLKMRQACCDPRLLKLKAVERSKPGSAKLDRLMDMLTVMLAEGRRVLLFSQFTEMLALIERRFWDDKIPYVMLTGDTKDRLTPVKRFQAGEVPVFLISLKAGGVGLNLTAADTVIHYDPWWNPAAEDQATDRAHRIGQTKAVFVHRLVTLGTIEEKMETLKDKKRALVASVLDAEHGGALKLTAEDVEALFSVGG